MRFFDGNWMARKGVSPHLAREAYDASLGEGLIELYCPDRPIEDRAGTVDGGLLTIRISSPREGVARVGLSHFEGGLPRGPSFAIAEDPAARAPARAEGGGFLLDAGRLTVRVSRRSPFRIEFLDVDPAGGELLLAWTGERRCGWYDVEGEGRYVGEQLSLGVGELVYGLGERFTPFAKNGQGVESWNEDG